jgi:PGF-pre-PGF domain-containing protein
VGGLVGGNLGGTVSNCYSTGTVSGGVQDVGGIAGGNYWGGIVSNCYSTGSVSCNGYVGGLVGWNDGTVSGCYSTGGVSGGYAVGGLVGANVGTVSNSFYDENTSGQSDTGKGEPKTTAEMKNVRTYTDNTWSVGLTTPWDFVGNPYEDENNENLWDIGSAVNNGYPYLIKVTGLNGSGTSGDPYVIKTVGQLQVMKDNLSAYYILGNDIDASATHTWNDNGDGGYYGFEPIGTYYTRFTGSLDGRGHKIINLYINRSGTGDAVGLFGYVEDVGVVENVGVENENVSGGSYYVGGLVGWNAGTVSNSYSTGSVSGNLNYVGGLLGYNVYGAVSNSYSTCSVSGNYKYVGGLVGWNEEGTVDNCYSTGSVSGSSYVGGLVGRDDYGTMSNCYSTGLVSGSINYVGGLVGFNNYGTVSNSYATGSVSGNDGIGGLVGVNNNAATVSNSYSTGTVSGNLNSGGLVGQSSGIVSDCYSTGSVSGGSYVGGLVGQNYKKIVSNSYSTGSVSGSSYVGGLVGRNGGTVSNCYSTGSVSGSSYVGGLVGYRQSGTTVSNSFWDVDTSGLGTDGSTDKSAGGTGKCTENMKTVQTYTDNTWSVGLTAPWDFVGNPYGDTGDENIWHIHPAVNDGYPFLVALMDFPPGLPVLYLPENGTSTDGNTPTFEWTAGANAENHRLLVGNDPGFTSPEIDVMLGPDDNTYTAPDENALPDDLYYWKVVAIRGVYENESDVWSFTVDTVPPVISNVTASSITTSSATITWTTDEPSDSIVEYETTIAYGLTSSDATLVTSHSRSLTGLSAGTTYHYRVKSTDNAGNPAVSSDYTFTTSSPLPPPVPDFSMSVSPTSGSVVQGGSANATVSVSSIAGFTSTVSLSASGLPSGATASFSSSSGTPSFNSTLTIPTSSTTPTGIYTITVTGAGAGTTHACTYTLTVSPRVVQETPPENIPRIEPGVPQTITVENMGITDLTINVGESVENVQISIQQLTDKPATIQIAAPGVVYQTFSIIVENLPEDKIENVVIHFKVEKSWIAENLIVISTIVLNRYDPVNAQWVSLPTTYLGEDDTYVYFSAVSPGLSVLAITGEIKILAPAAFSVSGLTTSPEHVGIGETVSISVMVKNTGDLAGTCVVTLKIGGTVEAIQNVTINGGSERLVTFTVTRGAVGIYSVDVDGLTGSFSVVAPPTVVPLSALVIFLIAVVVIGGLLGGIAVYSRYFGRRRMQRARRGRGSRIGRD